MRCYRFAGVMLVMLVMNAAAGDWPQFRGPARDGKAAPGPRLLSEWPAAGPSLLWTFEGLGCGYSSAAIADGKVYTTGMEDKTGFVYAIDQNGKLLWKTPYGEEWSKSYNGARTTPTVRKGRVYIMSGQGKAACYDAKTGREIWAVDTVKTFGARNIAWGITESPLVLDDKVIFTPGGPDAGVVALHPDTGATVWVCKGVDDASGYCSPILINRGGKSIVVQLTATAFIGIQADNGKLLWRKTRSSEPAHKIQAVSPVYENGVFYLTAGYGGERGEMYTLNAEGTGVTAGWRDSVLDCQHGGVVLNNGFIYGAADKNNRDQWVCLRLKDGTVAAKIPGVGKGSVAYADGMLYAFGQKGAVGLIAASPANFRLISSFKIPEGGGGEYWAHPSIADGRLYIRHGSKLFAYDISAR